ncbi:MAG: D-glycero-beta-D-manno-heptose 1-phosphate adenylyltransferase [Bacteroidota bacterium]
MWETVTAKVQTQVIAADTVQGWKQAKQKVVFTNGCFDLLHYGHIHYLAAARALGDRLIVGLNATDSVRRLKGTHRPIKDEKTRAHILAALQCVDAVVVFDTDTPLQLIKRIAPDILVKGGDWAIKDIVGADVVQSYGGKVQTLAFVEGYSTTQLEQKIIQAHTVSAQKNNI